MRPFQIEVALVPAFVENDLNQRGRVVNVVVDVIRATTTLTVAFDRGCQRVLLAPDIETALERASREPGRFLLGGEREGVAPPGFDLGNSPAEYARADLAGRELLFVTTNGTRALRACIGGYAIFAGSYRNAEAVVQAAIQISAVRRPGQHCRRLRRARKPASIRRYALCGLPRAQDCGSHWRRWASASRWRAARASRRS